MHQHPYLERLAQMYLMKIQYGESFSSHAGAVWRQLFVQAIMPWMRKYHVFGEARLTQAVQAYLKWHLEKEEDAKGVAERFGEDVGRMQQAFETTGVTMVEALVNTKDKAVVFVEDTAGTAGMLSTADKVGMVSQDARDAVAAMPFVPSKDSADQSQESF